VEYWRRDLIGTTLEEEGHRVAVRDPERGEGAGEATNAGGEGAIGEVLLSLDGGTVCVDGGDAGEDRDDRLRAGIVAVFAGPGIESPSLRVGDEVEDVQRGASIELREDVTGRVGDAGREGRGAVKVGLAIEARRQGHGEERTVAARSKLPGRSVGQK